MSVGVPVHAAKSGEVMFHAGTSPVTVSIVTVPERMLVKVLGSITQGGTNANTFAEKLNTVAADALNIDAVRKLSAKLKVLSARKVMDRPPCPRAAAR